MRYVPFSGEPGGCGGCEVGLRKVGGVWWAETDGVCHGKGCAGARVSEFSMDIFLLFSRGPLHGLNAVTLIPRALTIVYSHCFFFLYQADTSMPSQNYIPELRFTIAHLEI